MKFKKKLVRKSVKLVKEVEEIQYFDEYDGACIDTDAIVSELMSDRRKFVSRAVYPVQLRLPADVEPLYKALAPEIKRSLRNAYIELIRYAYAHTQQNTRHGLAIRNT